MTPLTCRIVCKKVTNKIRRELKTKYIDNKNKIKNNDQYLIYIYIPRLTLPKEFLNENNDLRLTILGGRLFQTQMIRSLKKMFLHINTTMVDEQFIWANIRANITVFLTLCCLVLLSFYSVLYHLFEINKWRNRAMLNAQLTFKVT